MDIKECTKNRQKQTWISVNLALIKMHPSLNGIVVECCVLALEIDYFEMLWYTTLYDCREITAGQSSVTVTMSYSRQ